MLERMKPERDHRRGVSAPQTENAALFAQLIVVERMGGEHGASGAGVVHAGHIGVGFGFVANWFVDGHVDWTKVAGPR